MKNMLCLLSLALASCAPVVTSSIDNGIRIGIVCDDHCSVVGDSVITVNKGDSASFILSFDSGYEFGTATSGAYENNTLTITNCLLPETIKVVSSPIGDVVVTIKNDPVLGKANISPEKTSYHTGEVITVKTIALTERRFLGYTTDGYYHSDSHYQLSKLPISFLDSYSFTASKSIVLFCNYYLTNSWVVTYNANGGKSIDGQDSFTLDVRNDYAFIDPSTTYGTCFFKREGYTLESFNTKADGSGTRIGVGSKARRSLFSNKSLVLYCQWVQWTQESDFEFSDLNQRELELVRYTGIGSNVVIPDSVGGKDVTSIASGAFSNSVSLKSIAFNESLRTVAAKAFENCTELTELHFFSAIKTITSQSFLGCKNLSKCFININTVVINHECFARDLTWQVDYLTNNQFDKELLLLVTHSTGWRNNKIDEMVQTNLKYRPFIFYGVNGTHGRLLLTYALNLVGAGKIVFLLHEGPCRDSMTSYSTLAAVDNNFDGLLSINFSLLIAPILDSFSEYSNFVSSSFDVGFYSNEFFAPPTNYDYNYQLYNDPEVPSTNQNLSSRIDLSNYAKTISQQFGYLNEIIHNSVINQDNVLFTWAPYNQNAISNEASLHDYENNMKSLLSNYRFVDSLFDNVYSGDNFQENDNMHMNLKGCQKRLTRWDPILFGL